MMRPSRIGAERPSGDHPPDLSVSVGSSAADGQAWDAYVETHPAGTADHAWAWRDVFTGVFGHECRYLCAWRGASLAGVLPLVLFRSRLFGRFAGSLPFLNYGGVLADDDAVRAALVAEARTTARAFGASHLELRHQDRQYPDLPYRSHKLRLQRHLPSSVEALWKDTDRKVRNQVRKAQKEGLEAVSGGAELVDEFYPVFARNMRDLGTPVYSRRLFDETLRLFPQRARVFVVRRAGQAIASAIVVGFRDTVLVPWASSLREYRALCPNMLLYWSMIERATLDGVRIFDFGRSSPGAGTHQFKLQWGATEAPLFWEYVLFDGHALPDQGPSNPKFELAIALWKRLPLWIASGVGPRLARELP